MFTRGGGGVPKNSEEKEKQSNSNQSSRHTLLAHVSDSLSFLDQIQFARTALCCTFGVGFFGDTCVCVCVCQNDLRRIVFFPSHIANKRMQRLRSSSNVCDCEYVYGVF